MYPEIEDALQTIEGEVSIEYDPNENAFWVRLYYEDGETAFGTLAPCIQDGLNRLTDWIITEVLEREPITAGEPTQ